MASTTTTELLAAAAHHWQQNRPLLPMYLHLLLSALFPIYTGAHASLSRPSSAAKADKKTPKDQDSDDDDEEDDEEEAVQQMEGLTPRDAVMFPIMAGSVLAGLYWLITTYGASVINTVLGLYFSLIGTYSVAKLINDSWTTIAGLIMPSYYKDQGKLWKVQNEKRAVSSLGDQSAITRKSPLVGLLGRLPLPQPLLNFLWSSRGLVKQRYQVTGSAKEFFDFKAVVTRHNALSLILGVGAIAYSLLIDKPWWLTNLQGSAVSYGALQLMSPTTFATGTLILSGLFFYDIWAVFFTPLMVTVAKSLDVPIKLVFPRPAEGPATPGEKPEKSYSMLGLGDIVLPGLMIALCLRFDLYMFYLRKQKKVQKQHCEGDVCTLKTEVEKAPYVSVTSSWGDKLWTTGSARVDLPAQLSASFSKPYFTASMIGYIIGMITTLVFMSVFQHAQPALLYLVPGVLISTWGTGLIRGELKEMWNFTEAITGEAEKTENPKESKGFFADLWAEIFGSAEESKDGKEEKDEEKSDEQKLKDKSKSEPDHVFSFTIKHYKRSDGKPTKQDEGASPGADAAEDEDSVLVSNADFDDGKVQPRFRAGLSSKAQ
ncbi:Putative presenilin/signal peptide peptidase [Septoria linicola]|uniref:Presenilin/signal peptide peptidase n=1 Tax=Septoria linicola TaxID=215465 RepID=A0A9Q9ALF8_9PEZI|nr:putative presenilin/signal peptide peptidase [Septoria linicola]USW48268.1 Putative presenilin/signal peptide peptidase [Septoria linicola]